MDLLSNKIEFNNIRPAHGSSNLQDFHFSSWYSILLDLDADIKILINNEYVFDCSMIPILELYVQLRDWSKTEEVKEFIYLSLENSDPIFELKKYDNNWYFISNFTQKDICLFKRISR